MESGSQDALPSPVCSVCVCVCMCMTCNLKILTLTSGTERVNYSTIEVLLLFYVTICDILCGIC